MEKQARPWWQYVLGCGCIAVLIGVIGTIVAGWYGYSKLSKSFFMDPVKVDQLAASIFPGAKPFEGHDGVMGMDAFGVRMAVISSPLKDKGTPKGNLFIFLMDTPEKTISKEEAKGMMKEKGTGAPAVGVTPGNSTTTRTNNETVLKTEAAKLVLGGKTFDAEKTWLEDANKIKTLRYLAAFKKGKGSAFIMVQGVADDFNQKAMDAFLAGLDASGLEPLPGSALPSK